MSNTTPDSDVNDQKTSEGKCDEQISEQNAFQEQLSALESEKAKLSEECDDLRVSMFNPCTILQNIIS